MKFSAVLFVSLAAVVNGKSKDEQQERRLNTKPLIPVVVHDPEVDDMWGSRGGKGYYGGSKGGKGYYGGYYGSKGSKGGYYSYDDDHSCDSSPDCVPRFGNGVQLSFCCPKPSYPPKCDSSPGCVPRFGNGVQLSFCCPKPSPGPNCYEVCYEVEYGGKGGKGSKGGYYGGKGGKGSKGGYYGFETECEWICEPEYPVYPPAHPPTPDCYEVCYEIGGSKGGKGGKSFGYYSSYYGGKGGKGGKGYYGFEYEECEWICKPKHPLYPPVHPPTPDCYEFCYEIGGSKGGKGGKSSGYYSSYYGGKGGKGGKGYYGFEYEECEWICEPKKCDPSPQCVPRFGNGVQLSFCCPKPAYPSPPVKPSYPAYQPMKPTYPDKKCDSSPYCYGYNCCPEPICYEFCYETGGGSKGGKGGKSGYYGGGSYFGYLESDGYYGGKGGKGGKGGYYDGFKEECETICEYY